MVVLRVWRGVVVLPTARGVAASGTAPEVVAAAAAAAVVVVVVFVVVVVVVVVAAIGGGVGTGGNSGHCIGQGQMQIAGMKNH